MAKEVITRLVDDIDGGVATQTVAFTWDGLQYEIDLSKKNLAALEKVLAPYVNAGRKAGKAVRVPTKRVAKAAGRTGAKAGLDLAAVRAWAKNAGHSISDRGRIPAVILEAYSATADTDAQSEPVKAVKKAAARKAPAKRAAAKKSAPRKARAAKATEASAS